MIYCEKVQKKGYIKLRLETSRLMSPWSWQAPLKGEDLRAVDNSSRLECWESSDEGP